MLTSLEIRKIFIDYFVNKNHKILTASPLVQHTDPTLMFTNAGMNQLKDIFVGKSEITDQRYVNSQPCLRVSGKHNDLDEVGVDNYHHTLFEMLGNWSLNDYFKPEAIKLSWELLTEIFKLDKNRLYVTIFEGDTTDNLYQDKEALEIWTKYINPDHILYGNKKDNFWEMGETGPCGPCTEIHIDIRDDAEVKKIPGKDLVNKGNPEVIEIWNIVFIQYERLSDHTLKKLDKHFIDTGMGFERLTMVLQNKKSTYETDIFQNYIKKLEELTNIKYKSNEQTDIAFRVISDHIRSIVLTISEGLAPSNIKQGYVIRRILRRAIRYGYTSLNIKTPFLYTLVDNVLNNFNFLKTNFTIDSNTVKNIIYTEEENFLKTLKLGIKRLDEVISNTNNNVINAKYIFELYDTFGFPTDLTEIILKEKNLTYDKDEYAKLLLEQKTRSRQDRIKNNTEWTYINNNAESKFIGYDNFECNSKIIKYRNIDDYYELVFNETPFYGESGGQVGDTGNIYDSNNNEFEIFDTKKINDEIIHYTKTLPENINDTFTLKINKVRRQTISKYHTCTHLLQAVLKLKFGNDIRQMGSKIDENKLRFDFNFNRHLTTDEIQDLENTLNKKINENYNLIENRNVDLETAKNEGFTGLFENKYKSKVRTIQFGDFSKELCGGTHVKNTSEIRQIKITKFKSISSGVKRIEIILAEI